MSSARKIKKLGGDGAPIARANGREKRACQQHGESRDDRHVRSEIVSCCDHGRILYFCENPNARALHPINSVRVSLRERRFPLPEREESTP